MMIIVNDKTNELEAKAIFIRNDLTIQRDRIIATIDKGIDVVNNVNSTLQKMELAYADRLKIFVTTFFDFATTWYDAHVLVCENELTVFNGNINIFFTDKIDIVTSGEDFVFNNLEKLMKKKYCIGQGHQAGKAFQNIAVDLKLVTDKLHATDYHKVEKENKSIGKEKVFINELVDYIGRLNWFLFNMKNNKNTTNFGLLQSAKTKGQVLTGLFSPMFAYITNNVLLFSHIMPLNLKSHEKQFDTVITLMGFIVNNIGLYSSYYSINESESINRDFIFTKCKNRFIANRASCDDAHLLQLTDINDKNKLFYPNVDPSLSTADKKKLNTLRGKHEQAIEDIILCKKGMSNKFDIHMPCISFVLNESNKSNKEGDSNFATMHVMDETQYALKTDGHWHDLYKRMENFGCAPFASWWSATIWHHSYTDSVGEGFERAAFGVVGEDYIGPYKLMDRDTTRTYLKTIRNTKRSIGWDLVPCNETNTKVPKLKSLNDFVVDEIRKKHNIHKDVDFEDLVGLYNSSKDIVSANNITDYCIGKKLPDSLVDNITNEVKYDEFCNYFVEVFYDCLNYWSLNHPDNSKLSDIEDDYNSGLGAIIRVPNRKNEENEYFKFSLNKIDTTEKFYFNCINGSEDGKTKDEKKDSLKDIINNRKNANKNKVFCGILTRLANCGDQIPSFVRLYITLDKNEEVSSVIQELFGRACGYKKKFNDVPFVFVSEQNKLLLEHFIKTGAIIEGSRVKNTVVANRPGYRKTLHIHSFANSDPIYRDRYMEAFKKLQDSINPNVSNAWINESIDKDNSKWHTTYSKNDSYIDVSAFNKFLSIIKEMPGCKDTIVSNVCEANNGYNKRYLKDGGPGKNKVIDYDKGFKKGVWKYDVNYRSAGRVHVRFSTSRSDTVAGGVQEDTIHNEGIYWLPTFSLNKKDRDNILFAVTILQKGSYKATEMPESEEKINIPEDERYEFEETTHNNEYIGNPSTSAPANVDGSLVYRNTGV